MNPSYANDTIPFDVFDAVVNPGESGALFIPTRVLVTKGQSQSGSCEHPGSQRGSLRRVLDAFW